MTNFISEVTVRKLHQEEFMKDLGVVDEYEDHISKDTPMRNYYRGKTILLTGGTGFLGQLYTEKALRSEVKCLYILARTKKGVSPEERIKNIFTGKHFCKLYAQDKNYFERIRIIGGDLELPKLGISDDDMKDILENVEIVIHAAADVRFDETLRKLLVVNLKGTHELLKISENIQKLEVFAYISTAYSHCYRCNVDEEFYEAPVHPEVMLKLADQCKDSPDQTLEIMQARIVHPWPNTYTYTKALSEELVRRHGEKFPICVIRPTVIISTHEDPIRGWCNNVYGLNGVLVAVGIGLIRILPVNRQVNGDFICADFVINSTLAAIWATHEDSKEKVTVKRDPEIYQICSSKGRIVTLDEVCASSASIYAEYPAMKILWKTCSNFTMCPVIFKIFSIYYHVIPAIFFDMFLKLQGKKLRLLPVYRKVQKFMVALQYFMFNEIAFSNTNFNRVLARMSNEDQEFFPSDVRRYNWKQYVFDYVTGLKLYIGFENLDDLPKARRQYTKLRVYHAFVLMLYYGIHLFLLYKILDFYNVIDYCKTSVTNTYELLQNL